MKPKTSHVVALLSEESFHRALAIERKRADRSRNRFVLMLLKPVKGAANNVGREQLLRLVEALTKSIRETDIVGWYETDLTAAVIFTEMGAALNSDIRNALYNKARQALDRALHPEEYDQLSFSLHLYPDTLQSDGIFGVDEVLYPDMRHRERGRRLALGLKRLLDVLGSLSLIVLFLPVILLIALLIKLTSKGPVLFCQQRVGCHNRAFTFLKFRSMYTQNDPAIHREYTKLFISGGKAAEGGNERPIYKIKADPRVTPLGRLLRRTSLDELPQLINVLRGDMSLVGPRPPVFYEFELYESWHKQRLLGVKPGITGLWQVEGRSRVKFDDMVRLDLRYATYWSIWLDINILMKTPKAVLMGEGAY